MSETYPLAHPAIFKTVQGEGDLIGTPMVFVRLAGCSVGCHHCDTDYRLKHRYTAEEIVWQVAGLLSDSCRWVWITGGEPTDHDLDALRHALFRCGPDVRVALATAGHKEVGHLAGANRWDWVSVSPHDPAKWVQTAGSEVKLVPGLNGFHLADFEPVLEQKARGFAHKFVQPCDGDPATVRECVEFLERHPGWRMTVQAHKFWRIP